MGARYTTIAAAGFNATPPIDDGSQTASNLITWSGIKTKLADPLHTQIDAINAALVTAFDYTARQITTADSSVAGDHMRCIEFAPTVSNTVTVALGDAATMTNLYRIFVKNSSGINQIISRVTGADTIDGTAANVSLAPGESAILQTNAAATGYLRTGRSGPYVDVNPLVVGSADGTKKVRFEVDGLTTGTTRVLTVADLDSAIGKQPTRTVLTSGSGTYTTPSGATRINVRIWGAGGGGGGSGTGSFGTASTAGGNTTFSTLTANGGAQGGTSTSLSFSAGGTASGGDVNLTGMDGMASASVAFTAAFSGDGGLSSLGGAGRGSYPGGPGQSAKANTGSGGGAAGGSGGVAPGCSGAAGGFSEKLITAPSATYSYAVGAKGTGGLAGTSGFNAGDGAAGLIVVDEYYN